MGLETRRGELLIAAAYVLGAAATVRFANLDAHIEPVTAVLFVVAVAVAVNVRFDVGAGFTVPTQVVFVPMLFALPPASIPFLMPVALALGMAPRVLARKLAPSWLLTSLGNSWFALGPVAVLMLFGDHSPRGRLGVLVLALLAQFVSDFVASYTRERLAGELKVADLLGEYRPVYAIDAALSLLGLAVALAAIPLESQFAVLLVLPLFAILRFFSNERHERLKQLAELNDAYQGTALLLGDVVEADDAYTGEHCKSVVRLALDVADVLGLDADRRRNVEFGALLHDIGKIAVPKEIINKPGALDDREWAIIKTHTVEGQRMLEKIGGFMREIGLIVRAHHERWDGSGYPDGLHRDQIPLEARIVAACDAFNAMTTARTYKDAMPMHEAIAEARRCAGTHFDPAVVEALLSVLPEAVPPEQPARELAPMLTTDSPASVLVTPSVPLPIPAFATDAAPAALLPALRSRPGELSGSPRRGALVAPRV
ncbi:MAG TPA: HD-GYP domain-containing protein [Solirubrobacteraceae bacterium]|nr:HD-GYP domain-containing protein [Solirubrobacteraceae bacterium]